MKLIDLLVKELPKLGGWPEGAMEAGFLCSNTTLYFVDANSCCPSEWRMEMDSGVEDNDIEISKEEYESALAASEGWIEWGGACPADGAVDVKLRNGHITTNRMADSLDWNHHTPDGEGAIIAYRLHKPDINSRANDDQLEQDLNECIGQDAGQEWDGDGLPPVGTICEALMPALDNTLWRWRTVKVVESGAPGAEKEVLAYDIENTKPAWTDEFRPLRTEAERAREDAETAMRTCLVGTGAGITPLAAKGIYEAIAAGKIPGVKLEVK